MPIVRIDIYSGFDQSYKKAIFDGVHEALVYAFKIPEDDRNQTLSEFDDCNFERSGEKTRNYTMIEISAFKGRTRNAKRNLYSRIVENLHNNPGIAPSDVLITINELDLVNWGVSGGKVADEVDLGFKVEI